MRLFQLMAATLASTAHCALLGIRFTRHSKQCFDGTPECSVACTADSLTAKFSAVGQVKMVRICQPDSGPRSIAQSIPGADLAVSRQLHALVEFENQDEVAAAVKQLTDSNNWWACLTLICGRSLHLPRLLCCEIMYIHLCIVRQVKASCLHHNAQANVHRFTAARYAITVYSF